MVPESTSLSTYLSWWIIRLMDSDPAPVDWQCLSWWPKNNAECLSQARVHILDRLLIILWRFVYLLSKQMAWHLLGYRWMHLSCLLCCLSDLGVTCHPAPSKCFWWILTDIEGEIPKFFTFSAEVSGLASWRFVCSLISFVLVVQ